MLDDGTDIAMSSARGDDGHQIGQSRHRVLILIDRIDAMGGAEALAVEQAVRLDPRRFARSICITRWNQGPDSVERSRSALAALRAAGVDVIGVNRIGGTMIRPWWRVVRYLRQQKIDVIHAHKFGSNVYAVALGRLARVPVVIAHAHVWSPEHDRNRVERWLDREWIARGSSAVIAVSHEGRLRMIERAGVPANDVHYIRNGIADLPNGDPCAVRAELGIAPGDPVIGAVARLRPQKALDVLVDAAARLRTRWPRIRVLIAGEGPQRSALERQIASHRLASTVTLLGYRTDVPDILSALDVAVCCSDYEGGPLSVLECMDAGLPVVATRVGALPDLLRDGSCGILVSPRDPEALAVAIERLLDNDGLRRELGERAHAHRRREFRIETWIAAIEQLYDRLLAEAGGARARV